VKFKIFEIIMIVLIVGTLVCSVVYFQTENKYSKEQVKLSKEEIVKLEKENQEFRELIFPEAEIEKKLKNNKPKEVEYEDIEAEVDEILFYGKLIAMENFDSLLLNELANIDNSINFRELIAFHIMDAKDSNINSVLVKIIKNGNENYNFRRNMYNLLYIRKALEFYEKG